MPAWLLVSQIRHHSPLEDVIGGQGEGGRHRSLLTSLVQLGNRLFQVVVQWDFQARWRPGRVSFKADKCCYLG